jgi:hypothetical protein
VFLHVVKRRLRADCDHFLSCRAPVHVRGRAGACSAPLGFARQPHRRSYDLQSLARPCCDTSEITARCKSPNLRLAFVPDALRGRALVSCHFVQSYLLIVRAGCAGSARHNTVAGAPSTQYMPSWFALHSEFSTSSSIIS